MISPGQDGFCNPMKIFSVIAIIIFTVFCLSFKLQQKKGYSDFYSGVLGEFNSQLQTLSTTIKSSDLSTEQGKQKIKEQIRTSRLKMKDVDFWFRYFEPNVYRRI